MVTIPRTNSITFSTNVGAATHAPLLVPKPSRDRLIKVNWWSWYGHPTGGSHEHQDHWMLIEGPVPRDALGDPSGAGWSMDFNLTLTSGELRILDVGGPPGGLSTTGAQTTPTVNAHRTYPGGLWTAYELRAGFRTGGGVDQCWFSVGFEIVKVSRQEWLDAHKINSRQVYTQVVS